MCVVMIDGHLQLHLRRIHSKRIDETIFLSKLKGLPIGSNIARKLPIF